MTPSAATDRAATRRVRAGVCGLFVLLPVFWVGAAMFGGQVLLPTALLGQIAPWGSPAPDGPWNPLMWDAMAFFYPIRLVAAHAIHAGHLPLWNPFVLAGTPLLADVQSAVLYPLNFLFWILPVEHAFGWTAYLHLVLAGLFTAYWLRREGAGRAGAVVGGLTFAFGGWSIAWLELPNFMATAVWLPLLLGVIAGTGRTPPARASAGCAVAVGMMLLGGHVQIACYALLGAAAYAGYGALADRSWARVGLLASGAAVGALLAAPQLGPARALSLVSHRSTLPTAAGYALFVRLGLPAAHLIGLAAPDLFGSPSHGPYFGLGPYSELTFYLGVFPLLLALHALPAGRRNPAVAAMALLGGLGLLLALGTPLNRALYFGVSGFARFGSPSRALVLVALAGSGLAGMGFDRLMSACRPGPGSSAGADHALDEWRRTLLAAGVLVGVLLAATLLLYPAPALGTMMLLTGAPALLRLAVLGAIAATLPVLGRRHTAWLTPAAVGLLIVDLWSFGAGYPMTGPVSALAPPVRFTRAVETAMRSGPDGRVLALNPEWPLPRTPRAALPPNLPTLLGLHDVGGYEGAYLMNYKAWVNTWEGRESSPQSNGNMVLPKTLPSPLLGALAVHAVIAPVLLSPEIVDRAGLRLVDADAGWAVYAVARPTSRASWYSRWPPMPGDPGTSMRLAADGTPNRIVLRLPANAAGFVLLRDGDDGEWVAEVDGRRISPVPYAAGVGRAVAVSPGSRELVWEYRPRALRTAWPLAGVGAMLLVLLAVLPAPRRRAVEGTLDRAAAPAE